MKKVIFPIILFVIIFAVTYFILCYLPSMRIKLDADPMTYFIESIQTMILFKTIISVIVGLLVGGLAFIISQRKA